MTGDRGIYPHRLVDGKTIVWYVRCSVHGRMRHFGSFATKTEARAFYQRVKSEARANRFFPELNQSRLGPKLATVIAAYLQGNRKASWRLDQQYGNWWTQQYGGLPLTAVTPVLLEQARQALERRALAPQTVLHYLKFIRHLCNRAVRDGQLVRSPFQQFRMPKVALPTPRFLTLAEERTLSRHLRPYWSWIRLWILTGLRKTELLTLRWADLNLRQRVLTLRETKAGHPQHVLLNREAARLFATLSRTGPWVFPNQTGLGPIDGRNFYRRIWAPAVEASGLPWVTIQDLRHTFASRLTMAGSSDQTIAALLRHAGTTLVKRYAHLAPSHLRSEVEKVSRFRGETADLLKTRQGRRRQLRVSH